MLMANLFSDEDLEVLVDNGHSQQNTSARPIQYWYCLTFLRQMINFNVQCS